MDTFVSALFISGAYKLCTLIIGAALPTWDIAFFDGVFQSAGDLSAKWVNEHGFRADVIERQLAHSERDSVQAAYNHAQYLPERRKMMQWWADYLDKASKKK